MKTILVPTSAAQMDTAVFATAFALAQSVRAHMVFYHSRLDPFEAAMRDPHAHFCTGAAISSTLSVLEEREKALAADAAHHFRDFCEQHRIPVLDAPTDAEDVSAQWLEETNDPEHRLLLHARHSDITVLGRQHNSDSMPDNLLEMLLKKSGRPIVIAPGSSAPRRIRTVVIGWKETSESGRALTAAMPLLVQAQRVLLQTVLEHGNESCADLTHLARQLAWHGVVAEPKTVSDPVKTVTEQLVAAAREAHADLLVIGGYGHSSLREHVFGGVTRDLII